MVNPRCKDPDAADNANIMRVIAAKNFHENIRIIVQLMRYQNKVWQHRAAHALPEQGMAASCSSCATGTRYGSIVQLMRYPNKV